jgi:cellulase/cellobiase CelA1
LAALATIALSARRKSDKARSDWCSDVDVTLHVPPVPAGATVIHVTGFTEWRPRYAEDT